MSSTEDADPDPDFDLDRTEEDPRRAAALSTEESESAPAPTTEMADLLDVTPETVRGMRRKGSLREDAAD